MLVRRMTEQRTVGILKLEKVSKFSRQASCCLSRTKPHAQRQGLNLYERVIQMAGDLRGWRVHTLTNRLTFHFKLALFIRRRKV